MPAAPLELILHATTISYAGHAALITGASGRGKSGLGLQLLALGAELVADDRTRVWVEDGRLLAVAPETIRGQIEARGVGIFGVPAVGPVPVSLVIDMNVAEAERLPPMRKTRIMDIELPLIRKVEETHFPAAILMYLKYARLA